MRERLRSDAGASIFMLAISLFLLIGASAIAVDIAAIWLDRSTDQKVTDAAAAVGVLEAMTSGGQSACETALTYVAKNTADIDSIDTSGCTAFSGACVEGAERELPVSAGRYDLTVVYPVPHDHDLMTSGIVGQQDQAFHEDDGEKDCERVGVQMASTRNSLFAQVLGFNQGTTTVHTVAKRTDGDPRPPFNLLVLDRTGCNAITVSGGGGIVADAVLALKDGVPIGLAPGIIAADSDGSDCSGSQGVISISGGGSLLRSDGAECETGTDDTYLVGGYTAQGGCGKISVYAPGTPGCGLPENLPACSVSGGAGPLPPPTPLGSRYTRKVADWRYNCYHDYSAPPSVGPLDVTWSSPALTVDNQQNIEPCEAADGTNDYIYKLIQFVGPSGETAGSFQLWKPDKPCSFTSGSDLTVDGNFVVNCNLQISGGNVIINGNVVFNGSVTVISGGSLTINSPEDEPWAFFRGGTLSKGGQGSLFVNNTMVYLSKNSEAKLTGGGSGRLTWTAPLSGPFKALALWSDSPKEHSWAGQAALNMNGIFFMPWATASYTGNGDMQQTNAQWIAKKVSASGNGALRIAPPVGDALEFRDHMTILIR